MKIPKCKESQSQMLAKLDKWIKKLRVHLETNPSHFHDFHAKKALERCVKNRALVIQAIEQNSGRFN